MTNENKNHDEEDDNQSTLKKYFRVAARDIANIAINVIDWVLIIIFFVFVIMNIVTNQPRNNITEILVFIATIMIFLSAMKVTFGLWIQEPERRKLYGFLDLGGKAILFIGLILFTNNYITLGVGMCIFGVLTQIYFHQKIFRIILNLFRN